MSSQFGLESLRPSDSLLRQSARRLAERIMLHRDPGTSSDLFEGMGGVTEASSSSVLTLPLTFKLMVSAHLQREWLVTFIRNEGGLAELSAASFVGDFEGLLLCIYNQLDSLGLESKTRSQLKNFLEDYRFHLKRQSEVEHAVHRMGLEYEQPTIHISIPLHPPEDDDENKENRKPPAVSVGGRNRRVQTRINFCLHYYRTLGAGDHPDKPAFELPDLPAELARMVSQSQTRFKLSPLKRNLHTPWRSVLDRPNSRSVIVLHDFTAMDVSDQMFSLLCGLERSQVHGRAHVVVLITFWMLASARHFSRPSENRYKSDVYGYLAMGLCQFHAGYDLILCCLDEMKRLAVFPSDKVKMLLCHQRLAFKYGLYDHEERIFAHLYFGNLTPSCSIHFEDLIHAHVRAVTRQAEEMLLEAWCELQLHQNCLLGCESDRVVPVLDSVQSKLDHLGCLLHQISSKPQLFECTRAYVKEAFAFQKLFYAAALTLRPWHAAARDIMNLVEESKAGMGWNLYTPWEMKQRFLHHVLPQKHNLAHWKTHCKRMKEVEQLMEDKADRRFTESTAQMYFSQVVLAVCFHVLYTLQSDLLPCVDQTIEIYEGFSQNRHFRLPLLRTVRQFLAGTRAIPDSCVIQHVRFAGMTDREAKKSLHILPSALLEDKPARDIHVLKQFCRREAAMLPDILRFGAQSLRYQRHF